ncbi:unnamed protein product [Closterium sp. Naga37s-1]|nr:unnamed protein product [Closterium sp. Naga37s-1]
MDRLDQLACWSYGPVEPTGLLVLCLWFSSGDILDPVLPPSPSHSTAPPPIFPTPSPPPSSAPPPSTHPTSPLRAPPPPCSRPHTRSLVHILLACRFTLPRPPAPALLRSRGAV